MKFVWVRTAGRLYPEKWAEVPVGTEIMLGGDGNRRKEHDRQILGGEVVCQRTLEPDEENLVLDVLALRYPAPGEPKAEPPLVCQTELPPG